MNTGRSPLEQGPAFYYAPPDERGWLGGHWDRFFAREVSIQPDELSSELLSGSERVTVLAQQFMFKQYGQDRYEDHIDRMLAELERSTSRDITNEDDRAAIEIKRNTVSIHDLVDHFILHPAKSAIRAHRAPEEAPEIKKDALATFNEMLAAVEDKDDPEKSELNKADLKMAFLFAIDASNWESAARVWRAGAIKRIDQSEADDELQLYSANILRAIVSQDTQFLKVVDPEELARVFKANVNMFLDLKLAEISESAINNNVIGVYFKGSETRDLIKYPPKGNQPSTMRDCMEALNYFVPALEMLGYKQLAMDLHGEALMKLFDDPNGSAKRNYGLSVRYFDEVIEKEIELLEEFPGIVLETVERVKTQGSTREKLARPKYIDCQQLPDGIASTFVVDDTISAAYMEKFASTYMERLTDHYHQFIARHPVPGEPSFEIVKREEEDGVYHAVHMVFYYLPKYGSKEGVYSEIQILPKSRQSMNLHGSSSHVLFKRGLKHSVEVQRYMDHLAKRGQAEREMAPGSTVQSISEAISKVPEFPFVFNDLYRAIDIAEGRRILVPLELERSFHELSDKLADVFGEGEGLIVLPPTKVNEAQFMEAIRFLSRDLPRNENILAALDRVRNSPGGAGLRDDGEATAYEGHILPTALSALMLATQSGIIHESEKLKPSEYMANIVTVAILHDDVEAVLDKLKGNPRAIKQKRDEILTELENQFGTDIMEGVDALTLPLEITDKHMRLDQYSRNVLANGYARVNKPPDRFHNLLTDLVRLVTNQAPKQSEPYKNIVKYYDKSDSYPFMATELSEVYKRVYKVIQLMAQHKDYRPRKR